MDLRRNTSDVYSPSGSLMSSGLLVVPRVRTETYGEAAISVYGPRLWNSLLEELRTSQSVNTFKRNLKTSLFSSAFY
jgi:DNA-binding transcriptional regulator/RsmH inhibitor MraZ